MLLYSDLPQNLPIITHLKKCNPFVSYSDHFPVMRQFTGKYKYNRNINHVQYRSRVSTRIFRESSKILMQTSTDFLGHKTGKLRRKEKVTEDVTKVCFTGKIQIIKKTWKLQPYTIRSQRVASLEFEIQMYSFALVLDKYLCHKLNIFMYLKVNYTIAGLKS